MLIDNSKEKLAHAITYFLEHTQHCYKTKLYKLLYFLDFQHYQEIGRSVTNLEYFAWKMGPVPRRLHESLEKKSEEITKDFTITTKQYPGKIALKLIPKQPFNSKIFSKRELRILTELAQKHRNDPAENMIEATHLENLPWHQVYEVEGRKQERIPYDLALKKSEKEVMQSLVSENEEIRINYDDTRDNPF